MILNKSYYEIVASCKLINYTEALVRTEYWTDGLKDYECIWLQDNDRALPSTVKTHNL